MNTPSPLIPQGALERQSKGKSTVRIAIFTIISIHAVFFTGLLMQGCRRDDSKAPSHSENATTNQNSLAALDNGYYAATQEIAQATAPTIPATTIAPQTVADSPPPLPAATAPEFSADGKAYTVSKGDTLAKIAKANGVTVTAIAKMNPAMDAGKLKPGQKIQIPASAVASTSTPAAPSLGYVEPTKSETTTTSGTAYVVKAGETLTRIAKRNSTTVKAIRAANNLKTDRVFVGQKLKLPHGSGASTVSSGKTTAPTKISAVNPARVTPVASANLH